MQVANIHTFFALLEVKSCVLSLTQKKAVSFSRKNFFTQLDKMNKILADGGSEKKWTAEAYVKEQFEKAIKETMLRPEDKVVK